MAMWAEVQDEVRRQFQLDADDAHEFALTVPHERTPGHRAQRVMVRHYRLWDRNMIEVRSAFGEAGEHDAEAQLVENLQLPLGAIARHGRFLVLLHKACLDHLSVDGVLFLLTRVSQLADVLEERGGADRF